MGSRYTFNVAGVSFEGRQGYLCYFEQHKEDVYYTLRRDKNNKYDKYAVAVIGHDRKRNKHAQVGFVPASSSQVIAQYLDRGYKPSVYNPVHVGGQGLTRGLKIHVYV